MTPGSWIVPIVVAIITSIAPVAAVVVAALLDRRGHKRLDAKIDKILLNGKHK